MTTREKRKICQTASTMANGLLTTQNKNKLVKQCGIVMRRTIGSTQLYEKTKSGIQKLRNETVEIICRNRNADSVNSIGGRTGTFRYGIYIAVKRNKKTYVTIDTYLKNEIRCMARKMFRPENMPGKSMIYNELISQIATRVSDMYFGRTAMETLCPCFTSIHTVQICQR